MTLLKSGSLHSGKWQEGTPAAQLCGSAACQAGSGHCLPVLCTFGVVHGLAMVTSSLCLHCYPERFCEVLNLGENKFVLYSETGSRWAALVGALSVGKQSLN